MTPWNPRRVELLSRSPFRSRPYLRHPKTPVSLHSETLTLPTLKAALERAVKARGKIHTRSFYHFAGR